MTYVDRVRTASQLEVPCVLYVRGVNSARYPPLCHPLTVCHAYPDSGVFLELLSVHWYLLGLGLMHLAGRTISSHALQALFRRSLANLLVTRHVRDITLVMDLLSNYHVRPVHTLRIGVVHRLVLACLVQLVHPAQLPQILAHRVTRAHSVQYQDRVSANDVP